MITRYFYLLTICLLLFSCDFSKLENTDKQKEFAQTLKKTPGILDAEWSTFHIIYVTVDLSTLGLNPKLKAQELADQISAAGFKYTNEDICVNIVYANRNKLASSCMF